MEEHTVAEKIDAQAKYQKENNYPDFAPRNGICWKCGRQIYQKISFDKASTYLITGCPYCFKSFCE